MNRKDFFDALENLTKCLSTAKINDRIDGLYHFFGEQEYTAVKKTADDIAKHEERFPTPAVFGRYLKKHRTTKKELCYSECDFCDSAGIIVATHKTSQHTYAFSCHCSNGAVYGKYPSWTRDHNQDYDIKKSNVYQDLKENPDKYQAGLNYILANKIDQYMPDHILEGIKTRIKVAKAIQSKKAGFSDD